MDTPSAPAPTDAAARHWYLLQCKPRQDERAEENLLRQGYHCYRPQHQRERILRGQRQTVSESLFPGYLFIQLGPLDNWAPLRSTRGVSRLVAFGNQPLPVSAELIAQLRRRCNASDDEQLFVRGRTGAHRAGPLRRAGRPVPGHGWQPAGDTADQHPAARTERQRPAGIYPQGALSPYG